jgi:Skp family chaperone for outer membrane proteins
MNGTEFIAATAAILFVAFVTGWFAHWLISRLTRTTRSGLDDLDRMAQEMHRAEEERDQAVAYFQSRESDLQNKLTQTEAELHAAMDGLRAARHEAEELRAYVESQNRTT